MFLINILLTSCDIGPNCESKPFSNLLEPTQKISSKSVQPFRRSEGWTVTLQCAPIHVGIFGDERPNQKVNHGAKLSKPEVPLTLRRAKNIISTYIDKCTVVIQKNQDHLKAMGNPDLCESYPEAPRESRSCFRFCLTRDMTLWDFMTFTGLAPNEACQHCGHARKDGDHVFQWTGLNEYLTDNIKSFFCISSSCCSTFIGLKLWGRVEHRVIVQSHSDHTTLGHSKYSSRQRSSRGVDGRESEVGGLLTTFLECSP
ncbi:reverse transcriptase [Trichonephila clavipes]|nr:reverse transcriptase [Trichonephila clavipes]